MENWIMSANPKYFNHKQAFEKHGYIDWKQTRKYVEGDIVYIYATKPISKIAYKTIVEKANMTAEQITDMSEFWVNKSEQSKNFPLFVRLHLLCSYTNDEFSFSNLQNHGMYYAPQSPCKVKKELQEYINQVEAK